MQYGSLHNLLMSNPKSVVPKVGMGVTQVCWTDRHAYTILEVSSSGKKIVVRRDIAIRKDKNGMSDDQAYDFMPDETAGKYTLTLRKNGKYIPQGMDMRNSGTWLIGKRMEYRDFSF